MYHSLFMHSPTEGHLGCSMFWQLWYCCKHSHTGFCGDISFQFILVNTKNHDYWIVWWKYVQFYKMTLPFCLPASSELREPHQHLVLSVLWILAILFYFTCSSTGWVCLIWKAWDQNCFRFWIFSDFTIFAYTYWGILVMGLKSKHEIHFCFICIYTYSLKVILYNILVYVQFLFVFCYTESWTQGLQPAWPVLY
jgi:hypothetical protein